MQNKCFCGFFADKTICLEKRSCYIQFGRYSLTQIYQPACETVKNGDDWRPLYWVICPTLMHYDIYPIGATFRFGQRSFVSYVRENLLLRLGREK